MPEYSKGDSIKMNSAAVGAGIAKMEWLKKQADLLAGDIRKLTFGTISADSTGPASAAMHTGNEELAQVVQALSVLIDNTTQYLTQQKEYIEEADKQ